MIENFRYLWVLCGGKCKHWDVHLPKGIYHASVTCNYCKQKIYITINFADVLEPGLSKIFQDNFLDRPRWRE